MLCCAKGGTGEAVATVIIEYSTKQSDVKPRWASCSQSTRFSKPNGCAYCPVADLFPCFGLSGGGTGKRLLFRCGGRSLLLHQYRIIIRIDLVQVEEILLSSGYPSMSVNTSVVVLVGHE